VAPLLAYADNTDPSEGNFLLIFLFVAAMIAVFILAAIVVMMSRRNGSRNADAILVAAVFWGIVSFGSIIYAGVTQMKWSQEQTLELQTGYGDPTKTPPGWPWILWGILTAIYVALAIWVARKKR
jgi:Kef-type K+ transport system membrane component KefB